MFPDFLKTKEKLQKMLNQEMKKARLSYMGPLADVPVSMIFEGNKTVVVREDSSIEETNLEKITTELQVKFEEVEEVEKMSHEMVLDKINRAAEEMAVKTSELFFERLTKITDETGNVVSSDGAPFSIDLFLELLEKMEIDFDEAGNPSGLSFVPFTSSISRVISQAEADPRYQAIIERKREEWYVRESNRKLVG